MYISMYITIKSSYIKTLSRVVQPRKVELVCVLSKKPDEYKELYTTAWNKFSKLSF